MFDFTGPPQQVAKGLLGTTLTSHDAAGSVAVRITETEAYAGEADPASHAYRGRTTRNTVMFGPGGHLYVYRSHGLHWCCNVVTGTTGTASAVLVRAGEVVAGHALARERRGYPTQDRQLARGPGNLAQALGLTGDDDGIRIGGPRLVLSTGRARSEEIGTGPRVGVTPAADVAWRFWIVGERSVSAYRRSPRAGAPGATVGAEGIEPPTTSL